MPVPKTVEITPIGTVRVVWPDGHLSSFRAKDLRARCPCAMCVDEWTGQLRVKPEQIPASLSIRQIRRVGNYALTFIWSDGHSTGIYPYDRLRGMCGCADCAGH
jgi:DUF971 family protein